jgi:catechol 2,3-dioxygenase-like lactoylglutathione lyase family enzyme
MPSKKLPSAGNQEIPMEAFVANKVDDYQSGRISRRQLIETLTVAAATAYTAEGAKAAAADPTLKIALVNHISYTCPNFKQAADWYSRIFNLDQVGETKMDVALPFGKKGERPFGVTANDVPLTHLIIRTRDLNARPQNGGEPRRKARALINHIAYTIADWDRNRVRAELARLGYANPEVDGEHSFHVVDVNGYYVQISGIEMTALGG